jgi:hypothetical protein
MLERLNESNFGVDVVLLKISGHGKSNASDKLELLVSLNNTA